MIVASDFIQSTKARDSEFTTNQRELPVCSIRFNLDALNVLVVTAEESFPNKCFCFALADDRPLIVQFAANNAQTLADAACIVAPFSDGVDLNCGCPQRYHLLY